MTEMTSRERVLTTLNGGIPDRVPFMELYVAEAFGLRLLGRPPSPEPPFVSGSLPVTCAYFGGHKYDPADLAQALGLDGFCMSVQPRIYFVGRVSDGNTFFVDGMIKQRADLALVDLPDPDDPSIYEPARAFLARYRPLGYAIGCFINLGSDPVVLSMGWDNFAYALYDDPYVPETLFDIYTDWYSRAVKHICALGFDFVWAGDDIAFRTGLMISPQTFRSLFMPYWRRVAEAITVPWIFHTDGNFLAVLDDLLSLGMNALHPIEPDAVDIVALKRRFADPSTGSGPTGSGPTGSGHGPMQGRRLTLVGNIDVDKLAAGTPDEVARLTRDTIRQVAPGGGYILSSSNSIAAYCQVENVLAMVRTCREHGRYPIST